MSTLLPIPTPTELRTKLDATAEAWLRESQMAVVRAVAGWQPGHRVQVGLSAPVPYSARMRLCTLCSEAGWRVHAFETWPGDQRDGPGASITLEAREPTEPKPSATAAAYGKG